MAIQKQQIVNISTVDDVIYMGTPERISAQGKVKLISDKGVVFIPLDEIKHVMRIIMFSC
ncbi:hypothetical protein D3C73_1641980 [compost metagenome]